MTIFAVMCAGLFPLIHMGRPWLFYWLIPYPNWRGPLWVNFRSPLVWDFFAISTYFTISLVFWYVGLIPDLATLRDRVRPGWYRQLGGLLQPGLERLVSAPGATTRSSTCCWPAWPRRWSSRCTRWSAPTSPPPLLPGWHTTIFPPYFVAGAIFSGMAMVLTLMLVARKVMHLEDYITAAPRRRHDQADADHELPGGPGLRHRVLHRLYMGNPYETFTFLNRAFGPLWLGLLASWCSATSSSLSCSGSGPSARHLLGWSS